MSMFDDLTQTAVADRDLLLSCDRQGDRFDVPRDVDFLFRCKGAQYAKDLSEFLNGKNYGVARVEENPETGEVVVIVVIHMPITQHVVSSVSGFMLCVSKLFVAEYDGWGSVIQPPPK
jgi:hypothetical protein